MFNSCLISQLFSTLKKTQIEKKEFFFLYNGVNTLKVLEILELYGYIRSFRHATQTTWIIFVKSEKLFNFEILDPPYKKVNKRILVSFLVRRPHCLFLLFTKNGVMCHKEAFKKNFFGILVARIW